MSDGASGARALRCPSRLALASGTEACNGLRTLLLWLAAAAIFLAGESLFLLNSLQGEGAAFREGWFLFISSLAVSTIGTTVLARYPRHTVGWVLYAIGVLLAASYLLDEYALYTLETRPGALPLGPHAASIEIVGATAFGLTLTFLLLLFPDGRPPSRRWYPLLPLGALAVAGLTFGGLLRPGPLPEPFEAWDNPFGIDGIASLVDGIRVASIVLLLICAVFGLASLVVRFRGAGGAERRQIEWMALGAAVLATSSLLLLVLNLGGVATGSFQGIIFSIGFTAIPVTVGIAILRYRLYDIDWIINRTLVYVPLTAILAGLYVAMTGLLRTSLTEITNAGSDAAIALSTLSVAALLTPLKNHLQAMVDEHFKDVHHPGVDLSRLDQQARHVIEVLNVESFLCEYLDRLVAALGADGGLIHVVPGEDREMRIDCSWRGRSLMTVPIEREGKPVGSIALGPRAGDRPYGEDERRRLYECASVVADLLALAPHVSPRGRRTAAEDPLPEAGASGPTEEAAQTIESAAQNESARP